MKQNLRFRGCYCPKRIQPIHLFLLTVGLLLGTGWHHAFGQENYTIPDSITPLQIGDTIPEWLWHQPLQVVNHPDGKDTITLNDYRGKLIILDFWATWCAPCVAMLPKTERIQRSSADRLQFVPVSAERAETLRLFLENSSKPGQFRLPFVVDGLGLRDWFPHEYLPHYVWIDSAGQLLAITDSEPVTEGNLEAALNGISIEFPEKEDNKRPYFPTRELLLGGQPIDGLDAVSYQETLMPEIASYGPMLHLNRDRFADRRVLVMNTSAYTLYRIAFSDMLELSRNGVISYTPNRTVLEMDAAERQDLRATRYCYELILGEADIGRLGVSMQERLNLLLPVKARVETRDLAVQRLISTRGTPRATDTVDRRLRYSPLSVDLSGYPPAKFVDILNQFVPEGGLVFVDGTGVDFPVALSIKAPLNDVVGLNAELEAYGLAFVAAVSPVEVLVISKP